MIEKSLIQQKLRDLWRDERSWLTRLRLAALCVLAFVFTFIIFGPLELYIQNMKDLDFPFSALVWSTAVVGALSFTAISLLLSVVQGRLFNYTLSFLFAGTLAGYLQSFLNVYHGSLDGAPVNWIKYKFPMLRNCLFWFVVLMSVFALLYFSRSAWEASIKFTCDILIAVQMMALIVLIVKAGPSIADKENDHKYISTDGIYTVAQKGNVIVFLLDCCDSYLVSDLIDAHPEWDPYLRNFIYYTNFSGSFSQTYPSVAYLLTGEKGILPYDNSMDVYLNEAWSKSTFLPDIRKAGYGIYMYMVLNTDFGNISNAIGKIDNIGTEK